MDKVKRIDSWHGYVEFNKDGVFLREKPRLAIIDYQSCQLGSTGLSMFPRLVEVYKNLHKGIWSVRSAGTGFVINHTDSLFLEHADFVVHPDGDASVLGTLIEELYMPTEHTEHSSHSQVHYDPDRYPYFYVNENEESLITDDPTTTIHSP
jgi:hypothetical protein